jgi:outer membrane protein TolC
VALQSLRQLLNLPPNTPVNLTTAIEDATAAPPADIRSATDVVASTVDTTAEQRAAVRQAAELVRVQEAQVRIAKSSRWPQISLTSTYQRFAYPSGIFEDRLKAYFPNWTASLGLSIPIYTGGRLHGEEVVARADLAEAQERLKQTREAASLDSRMVLAELELAEATYAARAGTDEQAARAYAIAEVRFNEGIGTQLELTQARVDLSNARANRAQTARDLAIARLKAALIRDLPIGTSAGPAAPANRAQQ